MFQKGINLVRLTIMVDGHVEGLQLMATVVPYGAILNDVRGSMWDATK